MTSKVATGETRRRTGRTESKTESCTTTQQSQTGSQWPHNNKVRIFLPPSEWLLARFLVLSLAAMTWYIFNYRHDVLKQICNKLEKCKSRLEDCKCEIYQGYDSSRNAEYIEIECPDPCHINEGAKYLWGMTSQTFTDGAWDDIKLEYDEGKQIYAYRAGQFPSLSKQYLERLANHMRYFYARGFAVEALQQEVKVKGKASPRQEQGFIDLSVSNLTPLLFALNNILRGTSIDMGGDSVLESISILIADLGDRGLGLKEALDTLYDCVVEGYKGKKRAVVRQQAVVKLRVGTYVRELANYGDPVDWVHKLLIFDTLYAVAQESIELIQRWPSVAIVSYGSRGSRSLEYTVITPEDLTLFYHTVLAVAEDLGIRGYDLLEVLRYMPRCVVDAREKNVIRDTEAAGLISRFSALYNSIMQGYVDRDILYATIRSLLSKDDILSVGTCKPVLRHLR